MVALRSTSTRFWSLVKSGNSKFAASLPCSALSSTPFTDARYSSVMYTSTRFRPITSLLEYPVISAALLFHSFTKPFESMPKIGAFAVSMNVCSSLATRVISSSASLRSVTSCPTPITPTTFPLTSLRVVALRSTSTRFWSLVKSGNSKFAASLPCSALSSTPLTDARNSSVMYTSTRF